MCAALLLSATGCQKEPPQPDVPGSGGEGQVSVMLTLETDDPEEVRRIFDTDLAGETNIPAEKQQ